MPEPTGRRDVAPRRIWPTVLFLALALFAGAATGAVWAVGQGFAAAEDALIPDIPNISVQPALDEVDAGVAKLRELLPVEGP